MPPTERWAPMGGQDLVKISAAETAEGHVSTLDTYQAVFSDGEVAGWTLVLRETFCGNAVVGDPDEAQRLAALAGIAEPERMIEGSEAPR